MRPSSWNAFLLVPFLVPTRGVLSLSTTAPPSRSISSADADQLGTLALASARKTPGSGKYYKAWRHWSERGVQLIRHELSQNLPCPVDSETTNALEFQLGIAADVGTMPSLFANAGARAGYALDFFCRSHLVADLLVHDDAANPPSFFTERLEDLFQRKICRLTSIGGGPGYDFVAASLVASFGNARRRRQEGSSSTSSMAIAPRPPPTSIHATVLDYEEGWSDLVDAMTVATRATLTFDTSDHVCTFGGTCDITRPMTDPSNANCRDAIESTDLWICQYCVAENASKLRETDFCFFSDLFQTAPEDSLFLFTETTHRLWPEFVDLVSPHGFDVAFPKSRSRGGHQMVLQKRKGATIREEQLALCRVFLRDRDMHSRKIESGFVRTTKKKRGSK